MQCPYKQASQEYSDLCGFVKDKVAPLAKHNTTRAHRTGGKDPCMTDIGIRCGCVISPTLKFHLRACEIMFREQHWSYRYTLYRALLYLWYLSSSLVACMVERRNAYRFAGCWFTSILQTGHITLSSTQDQLLEKPQHEIPQAATTLELLMMGIVVPETCWASNKIYNKNLCCI